MNETMPRRDFALQSALALLGGVVITITGCGDSGTTMSPSPTPTGNGDVSGVISANHGHTAVVTGAQLTAGNALVLDIMGSADHSHRVELSPSELSAIASRQRVSRLSTTNFAHDHTVTFN